ncbi:MAG: hypothetical protein IJK63_01965 [Oscillospiraceae bacterium]|nr:hypothetical protein [Oscillospiraceae bacterium]
MKTRRFLLSLCAVLLLLAAFPAQAFALGYGGESYRYPTITIVAYHAPEDLEIRIEVDKNGERFPAETKHNRRAWETTFRVYREDIFRANSFKGNETDFAGAVLICRTGGEEHRVPIPKNCLTVGGSRDVMTLDCRSWTLTPGLPACRAPLILGMRVLLVLAVNALIFLLMGYRELRSWLCMLGVILATQIPLNLILNRWIWVNDTNWNSAVFVGVMFMCLLGIVFVETMLLALLVQEQDRNRTGLFVGIAYPSGIAVLAAALSWLPV